MNNKSSGNKNFSDEAKRNIESEGKEIVKDPLNTQENCEAFYQKLLDDIEDLESKDFGEHWYHRAKRLKELGCGKLYKDAIKKAEEYKTGRTRDIESNEYEKKEVVPIEGKIDIYQLLDTFKKWLYVENEYGITIPTAYVISNFTSTDPGAFCIEAPSGSYKTEFIRTLGVRENEYVYPIDNLTAHTFVSGRNDVEDIIPQLHRRLITIKDFTAILAKREDERSIIFSDMREMLDGYLTRKYGSGKNVTYTDIHSSYLFGATSAIERYYSLHATLGQRIIFYKPRNNPSEARKRAHENLNKSEIMRKELSEAMSKFVNYVIQNKKDVLNGIGDNIDERILNTIGTYVDFVAVARTHISKDYRGEIDAIPEPEFPTRLFKEVVKIIACHAILYDREVSPDDVRAGVVVLLSNIPTERLIILHELLFDDGKGITTAELATRLHFSSGITKRKLDDLLMLGIVGRKKKGGSAGDIYFINDEYKLVLIKLVNLQIDELVMGGNPKVYGCDPVIRSLCYLYIGGTLPYSNKKDNSNSNMSSRICTIRFPPTTNVCVKCGYDKPTTEYKGELYCDDCLNYEIKKEAPDTLDDFELGGAT